MVVSVSVYVDVIESVSVYVDVIESVEVEVIVAVTELQEGLNQRFALTAGNGLWNKSKKHRQGASPKTKSHRSWDFGGKWEKDTEIAYLVAVTVDGVRVKVVVMSSMTVE